MRHITIKMMRSVQSNTAADTPATTTSNVGLSAGAVFEGAVLPILLGETVARYALCVSEGELVGRFVLVCLALGELCTGGLVVLASSATGGSVLNETDRDWLLVTVVT